ncbi:MAG: biotin-dependent carboxyltransferase family protein [Geminicoccaceae bacterium]|nr:biotin-dependent carboxyltransferase family protein [Geminicoccaceae bacterium]
MSDPVPALFVERCGPLVTVQDAGRFGYQRFGVTPAGPMDPWAFRLANRLLGQSEREAGLELGPGGLVLRVEAERVRLAFAGAERPIELDGRPLPWWSVTNLVRGQRLAIGPARGAVWSYLAIAGGLALPPVMGSRATHTLTRLGGLEGRPLRAGDRLPLADPLAGADMPELVLAEPPFPPAGPIRVLLGPQEAWFGPAAIATFLDAAWRISARSDRMGYRLEGPRIEHARSPNIVSDGIVMGSVQVPGSGQPIVLVADRQSTGGYPKIATVIGADIGRLAQVPAGGTVRFRAVGFEEALAARAEARARLEAAPSRLVPLASGGRLDAGFLLSVNLVSGVTAGEP